MDNEKDKKKLTPFLLGFAIVADVIQGLVSLLDLLLPPLGSVINYIFVIPVVWLTLYIWLKTKGVNMLSSKKAVYSILGPLIELIPVLNILPGWTTMVIMVTKGEEILENVPGGKQIINPTRGIIKK